MACARAGAASRARSVLAASAIWAWVALSISWVICSSVSRIFVSRALSAGAALSMRRVSASKKA